MKESVFAGWDIKRGKKWRKVKREEDCEILSWKVGRRGMGKESKTKSELDGTCLNKEAIYLSSVKEEGCKVLAKVKCIT